MRKIKKNNKQEKSLTLCSIYGVVSDSGHSHKEAAMKILHDAERQFAAYLDSMGTDYIYQPKSSALKGLGYTPDFYGFQTGMYYEVIGSKQAFHKNKEKIYAAAQLVPLAVVRPDGTDYVTRAYCFKGQSSKATPTSRDGDYSPIWVALDLPLFMQNHVEISIDNLAYLMGSGTTPVKHALKNLRLKRSYYHKILAQIPDIANYLMTENEKNFPDVKKLLTVAQ